MYGGTDIQFLVKGFTNPPTTQAASFTWSSYASLPAGDFIIDQAPNLEIVASTGALVVKNMYPTDGNYFIYGRPTSYTFVIGGNTQISAVN